MDLTPTQIKSIIEFAEEFIHAHKITTDEWVMYSATIDLNIILDDGHYYVTAHPIYAGNTVTNVWVNIATIPA